jgi:hypothetical protein
LFCAAIAVMMVSTGTAFAEEGGGNGRFDRYYDPSTAPPGFYEMNPAYQHQQAAEAYVINQERAWQLAHTANHNPPVAQSTTPPKG